MAPDRDKRQEELLEELRKWPGRGLADQQELARHQAAMLELAGSGCCALSRDNFVPGHFTASAFVLSPDRSSLLLIFHKKLGMWLQPGGHIEELDRNLVETARREVREETGLDGLSIEDPLYDLDVHRIPAFGSSPAHLHHDVRCLMRATHLEVRAGDDVSDARWFNIQMVASSKHHLADGFDTDGSVRRVAARLSELNDDRNS